MANPISADNPPEKPKKGKSQNRVAWSTLKNLSGTFDLADLQKLVSQKEARFKSNAKKRKKP